MRLSVGLRGAFGFCAIGVLLSGCGGTANAPPPDHPGEVRAIPVAEEPWKGKTSDAEGWEAPPKGPVIVVRGARLLVGDGRVINQGFVVLASGKIFSVGEGSGPNVEGAEIIEASGRVITPGLIDTHSHLGVYPEPGALAHRDGNELTSPVTAEVRTVDGFWPQDPGIERAVAGGVTTIQVLPGSGNLIGGRAVTLKLRRATHTRAMHFEGAPDGLKMACGENPKRVYGSRDQAPSTRMGNLAAQRAAFLKAKHLIDDWKRWREAEEKRLRTFERDKTKAEEKLQTRKQRQKACNAGSESPKRCEEWEAEWEEELEEPELGERSLPPERDLQLETLASAVEGRILVQVHCYRADDMLSQIALADEMGYKIRSFHHALEAYKIRDELARRQIGVSTWADWWGFKLEAFDGIPENLALNEAAGGIPIVHSDSAEGIQRLNQEAAKGIAAGSRGQIRVAPERAIRWLTLNPAWALGIDHRVGTLEAGKDADIVIWSDNPFSVYSRAERVFIDGAERYNALKPAPPSSDFEATP